MTGNAAGYHPAKIRKLATGIRGIVIVGAAFPGAADKGLPGNLMIIERLAGGMAAEEIPLLCNIG